MQVRNPPTGRKIWPVTKSKMSNSVYPAMLKPLIAPNESEQNAPIVSVPAVTMVAAFLRVMWNSSKKKAVLTSCNEMSDVSAAKPKRA